MLRLARAARTAEPAISAAEGGRCQRADDIARRFVPHGAFGHYKRTLNLAVIQNADDFGEPDNRAVDGQGLMNRESLFAMDDMAARNAGFALRVPRSRIAEDNRHRRQ